jgi:hypothetical protein
MTQAEAVCGNEMQQLLLCAAFVIHYLMDSRVEILAEELGSLPKDKDFDPITYVNRITRLHSEVAAEEDKVALLGLRKILLDLCDR